MKISNFIIGIILISAVIVSLYTALGDIVSTQGHNITLDSTYKDRYDKINNLTHTVRGGEDEVKDINLDSEAGFFSGAFDAFRIGRNLVKNTLPVGGFFITSFIQDLGFDSNIVAPVVLGIVAVLLLFALISIITRYDS